MRYFLKMAVMGLVAMGGVAWGDEWPQWRGPKGDNIVREEKLAAEWAAGGPKQLWSINAGIGYSSPVAVDGKVYIFTLEGSEDVLRCLDAEKGTEVWKGKYSGGYTGSYKGTRAAPTIEKGRIYTYGGNSDLVCWNQADGKIIWHINIMKETGAGGNLQWGTASAPLIVGDLIYVQNGDGGPVAVAVNKNTGKGVWMSEKGMGGYAHIILADVPGGKQLVVFGGKAVYGLNPQTGATLWKDAWETQYDVNASTPIYDNGNLFITCAYNTGRFAIYKVSRTGVTKVLGGKDVSVRFQNVILDEGKLYANSEGTIKCMQWPSGKVLWSAREPKLGMGGALLRVPGKRFIATSERGGLYLVQETDTGLKVIGEKKEAVEGKEVWATPLVYRGKVYVKGATDLVCFDIGQK